MRLTQKIIAIFISLAVALISFSLSRADADNAAGAPAGKTGSPADASNCTGCHSGPAFNGPGMFQKFPIHSNAYFAAKYHFNDDKGLAEVSKNPADEHLWKVPTWRNIALTAPYFHNGAAKTLDEAVTIMAKMQLDKELSKEQIADIVAFLNGLTGEFPKQKMPVLPATPGTTFN